MRQLKNAQDRPELMVSHIRTDAALDALEPEWNRLLEQCPATVFQSFEWARAWWKHFKGSRVLDCFVFRDHEILVGIAPFFCDQVRFLGFLVARRLQFLGTRLSDYLDILILPGYEESVLRHLIQELLSTESEWDVLDLEEVRATAMLVTRFPALLKEAGIRAYPYQFNVCPRLALPGTWDDFLHQLGPSTRQNIRRKLRRLNDRGIEIELLTRSTDDFVQGVERFAEIHGKRWKSLGHPSAFDDPILRQFHSDVARAFAGRGWIKLYFLKVDGEYVATSLNYDFRDVIYMYQCNTYGPEEFMRLSPGTILRAATIRQGIAEGMKVFDFLRGDETYKWREWKGVPEKNWMIRVVSRSGRSYIRFRVFLLLEILSKSRSRILREKYDYVRFTSGRQLSLLAKAVYIISRVAVVARLGLDFCLRHTTPRRPPYEGP